MVDFDGLVAYFQGNLWATALLVFTVTILFLVAHGIWDSFQKPVILEASPVPCGDITIDELSKFDGGDPFKPIYFAVRGKVYDVTKGREFYGSGELCSLHSLRPETSPLRVRQRGSCSGSSTTTA